MRQRLTRREALYFVGAAALSAARTSAQEAALEFDGIDHVEFYVSQVQRTRDFLAAVFGPTVLVNATAAKKANAVTVRKKLISVIGMVAVCAVITYTISIPSR